MLQGLLRLDIQHCGYCEGAGSTHWKQCHQRTCFANVVQPIRENSLLMCVAFCLGAKCECVALKY